MLHVEIVLKTKQPEAETSLVYDVLIRVIKKESASWTSDEKKKNGINIWSMWSVKMSYGLFVDSWNKGNILATLPRYLLSREAEMVRIEAKAIVSGAVWTRGDRRQAATENSQMCTVGLYNIGLCDGRVHLLVVLCLAKWTSWFVLSAHCYRNYRVCARLLEFSLEISFRG